jgi:hypothetical protein
MSIERIQTAMLRIVRLACLTFISGVVTQTLQPPGSISPVAENCSADGKVVCINKYVRQLEAIMSEGH